MKNSTIKIDNRGTKKINLRKKSKRKKKERDRDRKDASVERWCDIDHNPKLLLNNVINGCYS